MLRRLTGIPLRDYGCSLKAYRSEIVKALCFDEHRLFNQAILISLAGKWAEIPVRHYPRPHGQSKWSLFKLFQFNLDNLVSLSVYSFQWMAVVAVAIAILGMILVVVLYTVSSDSRFRFPSGIVGVLCDLIATAVLGTVVALVGEFVVRVYHTVDRRPKWIVREVLETGSRRRAARPEESSRVEREP
jgi:undecaprenyl-phosphate 4-deoxy-4-formamido-L-arabinose transferase